MSNNTKSGTQKSKTPGVSVGRARKTGDIDALKQIHWLAVRTAYRLMKAEGVTFQEQLSAVHAINQASGSYVKLLEATDVKRELEKMAEEIASLRKTEGMRKVA